MGYLPNYKKEDFKQLSWDEYGKTLQEIYEKILKYVQENKIKIDAVIPILRGGAFPGAYLAFKFNLLTIFPVQYKYFFKNSKMELRQILSIPKTNFPDKPVFLLVEQNHCFGLTGKTAAKDIKKDFPDCKIIYVADHMDYSYQKNEYADVIFYGKLTNETRAMSEEECKKVGIFPFSYLFPWESLEEEWKTVQGEQFEYDDTERVLENSEVKEVINLK